MASFKALHLLAMLLVLLLPIFAIGDDIFNSKICDEVECGKGKCIANSSYPFDYSCECDQGWKRTRDSADDLLFLPCVIPNCTLNYDNCQSAPPPVPDKPVPYNLSFFDPCYWIYCGEGSCTRNQTYTHTCTCNSGFFNLMNISYFPCYSQCTIGSDCERLGIKIANQTSTSTSTGANGNSQATSILPGTYHWMIILLTATVIILRK